MTLDARNLEVGPANVYLEESGVDVLLGYLGEDLTLEMASTASPLTGAQKGETPLDKVISGGSFKLTVPFKEITLENFSRAFPNSTLTGDKARVDFLPRVGLSMRSLAKKLTLKKIIGGVESTQAKDHLVILEASPVDGSVSIVFSPTGQRVIKATFEGWPDDETGRWAFMGDELSS